MGHIEALPYFDKTYPPALAMKTGRFLAPFYLVAACSACRPRRRSTRRAHPAAPVSNQANSESARARCRRARRAGGFRQRFGRAAALATQMGEASLLQRLADGPQHRERRTARPRQVAAAHRKLPFGSVLRVVRTDDGRSVYVKVNDRGPFGKRDRILDAFRLQRRRDARHDARPGSREIRLEVVEARMRVVYADAEELARFDGSVDEFWRKLGDKIATGDVEERKQLCEALDGRLSFEAYRDEVGQPRLRRARDLA